MTPEQLQAWRWEKEIDERNRPWSDEELDAMFPEGYKVSQIYAHHFLCHELPIIVLSDSLFQIVCMN